ncbi:asialoglycoprotein receptor 2 isoform X2 [Bubalus bubalis]|uniref:asialoglycoprotein receptor 2 isoform X2 n=1 Tax=Bubalus bubalis TaxID=89462 RepID=UPI000DBC9C39|nr:asialoglycoprotein receptor 2 isoform X2 [Bubalus bubalis]
MARDFQDIQQLDSEENDHQLGRGEGPGTCGHSPRREPFWKGMPPPQPLVLQRLCSKFRLSLLVLVFNVLLLVAICVTGSQRAQLQGELQTLQEAFSNFSSGTLMDILNLSSHGGFAGDKVRLLEAKLGKQQQDLKAGTECCPVNWVDHEGSCYWFSRSGKPWLEAEKYCQLENAHLVVINSREEQKFIVQHTNPFRVWIGLTDSDGSWKWVDGTDYKHSYKNWDPAQPDDWRGHELGASEDCAEIRWDGRWNDDFCQQVKRWVCETKRNITM